MMHSFEDEHREEMGRWALAALPALLAALRAVVTAYESGEIMDDSVEQARAALKAERQPHEHRQQEYERARRTR